MNLLLSAEEIFECNINPHWGLMALCAALCSLKPDYDDTTTQTSQVRTSCQQNQQLNLDLAFADHTNVEIDQLDVMVIGPNQQIVPNKQLILQKRRTEKGAVLSLVPFEVGNYTVGFQFKYSSVRLSVLVERV